MVNLPAKERKAKYVQDTFNSIARNYDLMNTLMTFGLDKSWRRLAVNAQNCQRAAQVWMSAAVPVS